MPYGYPHSNAHLHLVTMKIYLYFVSIRSVASHIKPHIIYLTEAKFLTFDSISCDILLQIFYVIQSDVVLQNKVH